MDEGEKLATILRMLREVIWDERQEEGHFARNILSEIGEAHGDEERRAERQRQWEADAPKRAKHIRELRRRLTLRREIEPVIAAAMSEKYQRCQMDRLTVQGLHADANAMLQAMLRERGEDSIGEIAFDTSTHNVRLEWLS